MRCVNRTTLILLWVLIATTIGIQIRTGASVLLSCLLVFVLLTGGIDIPIAKKRMRKPVYTREAVHLLEDVYSIPLEQDFSNNKRFFETVIAVNLGGFVIPFAAACAIGAMSPNLAGIEIGIVMIAVTHIVATFREGVGIVLPDSLCVLPLLLALLLSPGDVVNVAISAGVIGILIGLCTVLAAIDAEREGSARISLGGAGSFRAVYLTILLAVLASLIR